MKLHQMLAAGAPPIIAILRGVRPDEVISIGEALISAGIRIVEVPLNSPQPFASIERLRASIPTNVLLGAGTVIRAADLSAAAAAGAGFIVAPNTNPALIGQSLQLDLEFLPGVMTATEAFSALSAGARHLKLFPGSTLGPSHLKALREVLPPECALWAVGGTSAGNLAAWLSAGAVGIGVGSALYTPNSSPEVVHARAAQLVAAWHALSPPLQVR